MCKHILRELTVALIKCVILHCYTDASLEMCCSSKRLCSQYTGLLERQDNRRTFEVEILVIAILISATPGICML